MTRAGVGPDTGPEAEKCRIVGGGGEAGWEYGMVMPAYAVAVGTAVAEVEPDGPRGRDAPLSPLLRLACPCEDAFPAPAVPARGGGNPYCAGELLFAGDWSRAEGGKSSGGVMPCGVRGRRPGLRRACPYCWPYSSASHAAG